MLNAYAVDRVTVVIGGALMQMPAPDTFVECERDNDLWTSVGGSYGDVERVKNVNKMGTITLTLQQTSPTNDLLSGFYTADEQTSTGIFPVLVRDLEGTTMATALKAWVSKSPNLVRGGSQNTIEWVLKTDALNIYIGGNTQAAS